MICPRCNKPTLDERERDGVTIDVCSECRGIWLDRGELERLIAMAGREMDRYPVSSGHETGNQGHHDHNDKHHKDHGHSEHHGYEHGHHRKRNWLSEIFD